MPENPLKIPRKPELPGLELPLAYSMPFSWGALHITKQAHEAYKLVPLSADVIDGGQMYVGGEQAVPRIDFLLMSPQEDVMEHGGVKVQSAFHKKGAAATISFAKNAEGFVRDIEQSLPGVARSLADFLGEEQEGDDDIELPNAEVISNNVPQHIAHILADVARDSSAQLAMGWLMKQYERDWVKQVKAPVYSIVGFTALFGLLAANSPSHSPVSLNEVGIWTATISMQALTVRMALNSYFKHRPTQMQDFTDVAHQTSQEVYDSVHQAFCRHHFDDQMQSQFDDETGGLPDE